MNKVKILQREGIILHHSASPETDTVEKIEYIHQKQGMTVVGYHRLIKRDPKTNKAYPKTGRDLIYQGGHTYIESQKKADADPLAKGDKQYYNKRWVGVCLIGNYETTPINSEYYKNVIFELAQMCIKFNVKRIRGHREVDATACPGKFIDLNKVRADVSKILGYTITK